MLTNNLAVIKHKVKDVRETGKFVDSHTLVDLLEIASITPDSCMQGIETHIKLKSGDSFFIPLTPKEVILQLYGDSNG